MTDLITFGESLALLTGPTVGPLRHATNLRLGVAGAESNVAVGIRRLGRTATWMGRVGDDELGRLVQARIRGEDVTVRAVVDSEAPTALMLKEHRSSSINRVVYYRKASAGSRFCAADLDEAAIASARMLHVTGITAALSASAREAVWAAIEVANGADTTVCLDYNYRSALWSKEEAGRQLRDLTKAAQIVFAGEQEARLVAEADSTVGLAGKLAALGPVEVLIKRGARGAVGLIEDTSVEAAAVEVDVVDPVGAGDAFVSGYLAAHLNGDNPSTRLNEASLCRAFVVTTHGDWEGLPERRELALLEPGASVLR